MRSQEVATSVYTLFEHAYLPFPWEQRHVNLLERIRTAAGVDYLSLTTHHGQRVLRSHHFVGTLRLGRDTITVVPKIDYGENAYQSANRNLLHMLELAGYMPRHQQSLTPMLRRDTDWFEIFTQLFALELQAQWRRGPHRSYQHVENDLGVIKGRWQIDKQLRQPARDHRFTVAYDEFTMDNRLSRVFRYVVEQLWRRTRNDASRRLLGELRQWLDPVTLPPFLSARDIPPGMINRLNERFKPALDLAALFLSGRSLEIDQGDLNTFAFMFDMNDLFEDYVVGFIKRYRAAVLPSDLDDCTLHPQTKHHTRHLAVGPRGQQAFRLKPDLAFRCGAQFPLLLDTKYKALSGTYNHHGISQADFYQMFAYIHRYQARRVILLYPQTTAPIRAAYALNDHHATITAATIDLHRDLGRADQKQALAAELNHILIQEETHEPLI